jgi:colanic acid/amylovoran biosynthesis glycosyltransferase
MRIGLIIPAVPGYSETFFRNKIEGLQKYGVEVLLFASGAVKNFDLCPYYPQAPVHGLFPIKWLLTFYSMLRAIFRNPHAVWKLFQLERHYGASAFSVFKKILANSHILQHRLDWLHFGFGTMAIGRENLAKAMGAKMAVSLRGFDISIYPLKNPGCYKQLWNRLDQLHIISDDLLDLAIKNGLDPKTPVIKITPAIDVEKFKRKTAMTEILHQPLRLLTVARLHWKKGLEHTLQAVALLKQQGVSFHYTIIGDGEEYERLIFTAHQLGIQDQVHFTGKKSPEEVKQAMEETDIYLQYSISEGFCNAVLEAQAMGCLCVVSDAGGLPENVLHGETGWVVPKRRPDLLAEQLLDILSQSPDFLQQVRTRAISRTQAEFGLEKQIRSFMEFYNR